MEKRTERSPLRRWIRVILLFLILVAIITAISYTVTKGKLTITPQAERAQLEILERTKAHTTLAPFTTDGCSGNISSAWTTAITQLSKMFDEVDARYGDTTSIPFEYACEIHDRAYHAGEGGYRARLEADNALRAAILDYALTHLPKIKERTGLTTDESALYLYDLVADLVYHGVRFGGAPCSGQPYAWGYGYGGGVCE